jgi:hypothetical protein
MVMRGRRKITPTHPLSLYIYVDTYNNLTVIFSVSGGKSHCSFTTLLFYRAGHGRVKRRAQCSDSYGVKPTFYPSPTCSFIVADRYR